MTFGDLLRSLLAVLDAWIAARILRHLPPPQPAPFRFTISQRRATMPVTFDVTLNLPAVPTLTDPQSPISRQTLVITVDGTARPPADVPLTDTSYAVGALNDGQVVGADLDYTNAAGYTGAHRIENVTISSALFPPQPGEFGFSVTEQGAP